MLAADKMQISFLLNPNLCFPGSICPNCKKQFSKKSSANRHYKYVHGGHLSCPYCCKRLKCISRADMLRQHLHYCPKFNKECTLLDKETKIKDTTCDILKNYI